MNENLGLMAREIASEQPFNYIWDRLKYIIEERSSIPIINDIKDSIGDERYEEELSNVKCPSEKVFFIFTRLIMFLCLCVSISLKGILSIQLMRRRGPDVRFHVEVLKSNEAAWQLHPDDRNSLHSCCIKDLLVCLSSQIFLSDLQSIPNLFNHTMVSVELVGLCVVLSAVNFGRVHSLTFSPSLTPSLTFIHLGAVHCQSQTILGRFDWKNCQGPTKVGHGIPGEIGEQ
jgi:hypothetical protein